LIEFTLLDSHIGLIIDDIQFVLGYMQNLIKLTLSIRDTSDPIFCNGTKFESILNEYVSNLEKFDYTITHRISDTTLIEDLLRWPMNVVFYGNENCKWIHGHQIEKINDDYLLLIMDLIYLFYQMFNKINISNM
jgi:hypothetical protein